MLRDDELINENPVLVNAIMNANNLIGLDNAVRKLVEKRIDDEASVELEMSIKDYNVEMIYKFIGLISWDNHYESGETTAPCVITVESKVYNEGQPLANFTITDVKIKAEIEEPTID